MTEQIERLIRWALHTVVMAAWEHVRRECSGFICRAEGAYTEAQRLGRRLSNAETEVVKLEKRIEALESAEDEPRPLGRLVDDEPAEGRAE